MNTTQAELREKLAAIEHERWSDWMEYMLGCAVKSGDDTINIRTCGWPTQQFEHWQRQIETDYSDLSKKEQASDMEQVDRYWPLIEQYVHTAVTQALQSTYDRFEEELVGKLGKDGLAAWQEETLAILRRATGSDLVARSREANKDSSNPPYPPQGDTE